MNRNALITGVLLVVVFIAGFGAGRMTQGSPVDMARNIQENTVAPSGTADTQNTSAEGGATVNTSALSAGQRQMLEAMGIDADTVNITPEMVACAEAKLGAARIEEIKNGATPSFSEGASLVACYR
jgi:hypothetical protein